MKAIYRPYEGDKLLWCNTHQRKADHIFTNRNGEESYCCSPHKGGIMLPCSVVDLTGIAELVTENRCHDQRGEDAR
jgi:hypothetical protein